MIRSDPGIRRWRSSKINSQTHAASTPNSNNILAADPAPLPDSGEHILPSHVPSGLQGNVIREEKFLP